MCAHGLLSARWCLNSSHIFEKLVLRHTCCVPIRENLLKLQLNSGHTRGKPCLGTSPSPPESRLGLMGGRTQAYEKACYMQLPSGHDKYQEGSTQSTSRLESKNKSVKHLSTRSNCISFHRPQRCCQVKSMSHGYLHYPFSAVFIHQYHCFSPKHP